MSRHLKTRIINGLGKYIARFVQLPPDTPVYSKGVRYFVPVECYNAFWGAMNTVEDGRHYKKHIIVRRPSRLILLVFALSAPVAPILYSTLGEIFAK